jgi:hypothetical protein
MSSFGEIALQSLTQCLSTPELNKCPVEVLGIFSVVVMDTPSPTMALDERQRRETALTTFYRWMSFRRTPTQINQIISTKCTCSKSSTAFGFHGVGVRTMSTTSLTPVQYLLLSCGRYLRNLHEQLKHFPDLKLHLLAKREDWPYNTAQLLPHGPYETISGYMDWLAGNDITSVGRVMLMFIAVVEHAWPIVVPVIIKNRLLIQPFVDATTLWSNKWAQYTMGDLRVFNSVESQRLADMLRQLISIMRMVSAECSDVTASSHYLRTRYKDVLESCHKIVSITTQIDQQLQTDVSKICNHVALDACRAINEVLTFIIPSLNPDPRQLPWRIFLDSMQHTYLRQQCAAPDCRRTTEQLGRPFRFCAGCLWVPYCSRACQKKAWRRTDGLQHRDICKHIRLIRPLYYIPHTSELRAAMKREHTLTPQELPVVKAIVYHFLALTMHEIEVKSGCIMI